MEKLHLETIGYWNDKRFDPQSDIFINPQALVLHDSWTQEEKAKIVSYLKGGYEYVYYLGFSYDRFDSNTPDEDMGSSELTDGAFSWPFGLAHYVEKYNIELPEEFLEVIRFNNYKVVMYEELENYFENDGYEHVEESTVYWRQWCLIKKENYGKGLIISDS